MQQPQFDFKKLRAEISLQYGIELDETSLAILAILMLEIKRQFKTIHKSQEEMADQIQQSKKALQVDYEHPRWQAFWHGMGQWGLALCLAIVSALAVFSINWSREREEKEQLQSELAWYKAQYRTTQKENTKTEMNTVKKKVKSKNK